MSETETVMTEITVGKKLACVVKNMNISNRNVLNVILSNSAKLLWETVKAQHNADIIIMPHTLDQVTAPTERNKP